MHVIDFLNAVMIITNIGLFPIVPQIFEKRSGLISLRSRLL
jgi:hypothetical protein